MEGRQYTTYMMYEQLESNRIGNLIGPMFQFEIDHFKTYYPEYATIKVIEELAFKSLFKEVYTNHIHENWVDKAYTYFKINEQWIGRAYTSPDRDAIYCDWMNLVLDEKEQTLYVNHLIHCNPFYRAKVQTDMMELFPNFKVVAGSAFYVPKRGGLYENSEAIKHYLIDRLYETMSLN